MNMNWKLVSAFATGAVLASGIVYFAVSRLMSADDAAKRLQPRQDPSMAAVAAPIAPVPRLRESPLRQCPAVAAAPVASAGSRKAVAHAAPGAASKGSG